MMNTDTDRLRALIGKTINYRSRSYRIIELLDMTGSNPQLVLQSDEQEIQPDQWGDAHRKVPVTVSVTLYDQDGHVKPDFRALLGD